ncbi:MAG: hypothetical protein ACK41D_01500 [Rubricoccaceae bacterium]
MASRLPFQHRGFTLHVTRAPGRFGEDTYGYRIEHRALTLHASTEDFRSATAAERAARQFVDDALLGFERANDSRRARA